MRVAVSLLVTSNISLGVSPPSMAFVTAAGLNPGPQVLNIISQGGALPFFVTAQSGVNWLSVTPTTGTTPAQLIVSANVTGLSPGNYDGTITVASNQASNPTLTVPVSLVVGQPQSLTVTPLALTFSSVIGEPAPASQTIKLIPSAATVSFKASAEVAGSVPWLKVTPGAGTAPVELTVVVDPTNLDPAVYTGTLTVTPVGLPQVVIAVSYQVAPPPLPAVTSAVNAASLLDGALAPGEIVIVRGSNTGFSGPAVVVTPNADGSLPLTVGDTQVLFDTTLAPILAVENKQVTVVVPYEVAGQPSTLIQVKRKSVYSNLLQIPVAPAALGVFTSKLVVANTGVILNADGSLNSETNPAPVGTDVRVFYTGDGQTTPPTATNSVNAANPFTPALLLTATLGGATASVTSFGPLPGSFAGVSTATVTVPALLGPGAQPLFLLADTTQSQGGVFVYVSN